jgi:hypothetical protein
MIASKNPCLAGQSSGQSSQSDRAFLVCGDFGFHDAVNPVVGEVSYNYLCLNQAMILVALADHLADHAVQKHFAADPIVRRIVGLVGIERFVD